LAQRQIARTIIVLASLGMLSTPGCATQILSARDVADIPGSFSLYGSNTADQASSKSVAAKAARRVVAAAPESGAWLMMLAGFGLLGAISRRGTPYPQDDAGLL